MINYKKYSLFIILDAYVTKNAIIDFLSSKDQIEFKDMLLKNSKNPAKTELKISNYIKKLNQELTNIDLFLNDDENIHWQTIGLTKEFFDKNLPYHKRKLNWFTSVDRCPFDYTVFFRNNANSTEDNIFSSIPIGNEE